MSGTGGIEVRPARTGEQDELAAVLMEALGVKYGPALGPRAQEALRALIGEELAAGHHGYLVAVREGRLVGAVHLATADDRPPPAVLPTLRRECGPLRAVWALSALSLLGHRGLARDEAHIGELSVREDARRAGVASALLAALADRARAMGKRRLTLWVTVENDAARRLYARNGFRDVRRRRWRAGRLVFGSAGAVLMERRIAP